MHSYLHGHPALIHAVRQLEHLGLDKFELYFLRKTATKIDSKNQQVDSLSRSEDIGLSIRLIKDKRLGFSFTTSMEKDAISRAIQSAAEIASFMPADEHVDLFSFGSAVYPEVDLLDSRGLQAPLEHKIALAKELEAQCRKADRRVTGVRSASVTEIASEVHMVDSSGEHVNHSSSLYTASITCKAEDQGDSQMGSDFAFSNYLDNLDITQVAARAAHSATELLGAKNPPTLRCPAVLRNDVVADLIGFLSSSFSAEEIDKGRSMLAGKKGERLFSEHITLYDDGLLPGGLATSPFDAEGIPSSKTTLVDGGFISNFLYDLYYARKFGEESTGNSSRGIKSPPSIDTSNLYLQKGRKSFDQLLDGISEGILITDLMGLHTANAVTGDFSLGASGILIEKGKLTRPVRGFAVAGNILDLLRKTTDVGSDLRFFGSVGAPSIRVRELSVGGN